jgi:phenylpropionate dioxygenase-like ring-hydroxylating dioxygenase large terminal subunit
VADSTGPGWFTNVHPSLRRCWHPVARTAELDAGPVQAELLGERYVVARLGGRLLVGPDRCPHRRVPLSLGRVAGDELACAYHGYRFDGIGRCTAIPALGAGAAIPPAAHLRAAGQAREHLGLVWVALDEPLTPLPEVPEHDDPRFTACPLPPVEWRAGAAQMADNFLDVAHFPYLHTGTFADPDDTEVAPYDVVRDGWTFTVVHRHTTKLLAAATDPSVGHRATERVQRFTFVAPHHVRLRIDYVTEGTTLTITFFHQPLDAHRTRLWCTDYRDDIRPGGPSVEESVAFQLAVAAEDRAVLEAMPDGAVPIVPGHEVHTRADRITVELRRVLADLATTAPSPDATAPDAVAEAHQHHALVGAPRAPGEGDQ